MCLANYGQVAAVINEFGALLACPVNLTEQASKAPFDFGSTC